MVIPDYVVQKIERVEQSEPIGYDEIDHKMKASSCVTNTLL